MPATATNNKSKKKYFHINRKSNFIHILHAKIEREIFNKRYR